jgi:TonB family protein
VVIDRPVPPWEPQSPVDAKRSFHGVFEIVVDERGRVTSAILSKPVHPAYDEALLKALRTWTFRPATKGGQPVAYRYSGDINLGPNRYR